MSMGEHQGIEGVLTIVARDVDGAVLERRVVRNLITRGGKRLLAELLAGSLDGGLDLGQSILRFDRFFNESSCVFLDNHKFMHIVGFVGRIRGLESGQYVTAVGGADREGRLDRRACRSGESGCPEQLGGQIVPWQPDGAAL